MKTIIISAPATTTTMNRLITMLSDVLPDDHESRCDKCGHLVCWREPSDFQGAPGELRWSTIETVCATGCCINVLCAGCNAEWCSMGPVGCPTCCPLKRPARIIKIHRDYARRRR